MSDFLVGKFKSLEADQSLKVGNKTITNLIDSAAVTSQINVEVEELIDSDYIQSRQDFGGFV